MKLKSPPWYLLPGLIILGAGAAVYAGLFDPQEMAAYDLLMRTRPAQATSPDIAIIEIADDTLKALGRWPLPREYHAALIKALSDNGCRMIVFDILFSEQSASDDLLGEAMRASNKVYLPCAFKLETKASRKSDFPVAHELLGGVAESLKTSTAGTGHINIMVDTDGKARRAPLWIRYGGKLVPSIGLLAAAGGAPAGPHMDKQIPTDPRGAVWVNFPGRWEKTFQHFSYIDVLKAYTAGQNNSKPWLDLNVFKDKICFVGLTAVGTSDFRANPIDPVYPMIGTQASICDSILRGAFIRRPPALLRALSAVGIILACILACLHFIPFTALLVCCLAAALYACGAWLLFSSRGIFLDVVFPLGSIALVYAVVLLRKFLAEAQKRRLLEKELQIAAQIQTSFLPPDVRQLANIRIRTFLKPARFVGGDLYDIISLDESTFGIFIGDVSGKGVSAALIMAQAISLLRVIARDSRSPEEILNTLNNRLNPILKGLFVTSQYIVVHAKEGFWEAACAGHPPFLLYSKMPDNLEEAVPASGPPLGLMPSIAYTRVRREFQPGDKIVMYTDGWTEARDRSDREFGIGRLKEAFLADRAQPADTLLDSLLARHEAFEGKINQHDDLTTVILEFT